LSSNRFIRHHVQEKDRKSQPNQSDSSQEED
jgi:hypothetical protein